jgi:hypothetical protein
MHVYFTRVFTFHFVSPVGHKPIRQGSRINPRMRSQTLSSDSGFLRLDSKEIVCKTQIVCETFAFFAFVGAKQTAFTYQANGVLIVR